MINLKEKFEHLGIVCPLCKGVLSFSEQHLTCRYCNLSFPIIQDIVDLHYPYKKLTPTDKKMLENFTQASFDDLLAIVLQDAKLPETVIQDTLHYYNDQIERNKRMTESFLEKLNNDFGQSSFLRSLDLGCGSGAGLLALAPHFKNVIGLDASMPQLLLAKKILTQSDYVNICLLRANAKYLPFKNHNFNYIQAINVLEHLVETSQAIQEISRCLIDGGFFAADSRNRFDIFYPEPHTGIRFLGFLPRKFIPAFVKFFYKSDYDQTWLLSQHDIKRTMKKFFKGQFTINFPKAQAYGKSASVDRLVKTIDKIPIIRELVLSVFPTHIILGQKLNGTGEKS